MSSIDLTTILGNISLSLISVRSLALGAGYLLGLLFVISGLIKLTKVNKHSQERASVGLAYIVGGTVLLYLPSSYQVLSNTFFGSSSILQYTQYNTFDIYDSMRILIQTAVLIWFVRGSLLLVRASEPGKQEGIKGLLFVIFGVFAVNFNFTVDALNGMFAYFMKMTSSVI